jgi:hypothetical protein
MLTLVNSSNTVVKIVAASRGKLVTALNRGKARPTRTAVLAVGVAVALAGCDGTPDDESIVDYNWHVRPILSENCFLCHGPDPSSRKAGLRLDERTAATAELPQTPGRFAIVPGDAARSELVRRVRSTDVDERMPPLATHKTLTDAQIAALERWIEAGAEYRPHWAFIAPERSALPAGEAPHPIDRFVQARLARESLAPASEADRETLINRATLTLTGLPPTLDEVDTFVADPAPDAYERLVDRLLASSAYAEHMAGYWLDLARFSETDGFLDDHHDRLFWPWRDFVIDAFARNMPFNEFGTWQLAGDLLPNASREQVLATAYLRVGKRTTENGAIDAEYKAEYMIERTDNALGTAFLGLTLGCARCHDHKYDPITQAAYYSLGAFFNSTDEPGAYAPGFSGIQGGPTLPWPSAEQATALQAAAAAVTARTEELDAAERTARAAAETEAAALAANAPRVASVVRASLAAALAAHYEFESARPAALSELPRPRPTRVPPPGLSELRRSAYSPPASSPDETPEQRRRRETAELAQRVPRNYNAESLTLSPSATPGVAPAVIQSPVFGPGKRGHALFFDETNRGFLGRDVGYYDRTEPFTIDFWFYVAARYDNVPVLNHLSEQNSGRTGYRLTIQEGRLFASLAHSPPANMIATLSNEELPVGEWSHLTLTYDGSSRADGLALYLNGAPLATRVEHDHLTRTILPFTTADVFDPFVGLAFGTRFREKAPVGSGIDELRLFERSLTPFEVAFLHDEQGALAAPDAAIQIAAMLTATASPVAAARAALTEARTHENELATGVPQVLVMGDAPEPIPTFVLERGVYSSPGEPVPPRGLTSVFAWSDELPQNRLGLAQWLFDPRHPLTARVFVNRIWQMHFGRGIVETAEDFGSQGSIPTHPELLDWLAVQFVESGWDLKALHRLIVTSATYRQSSSVGDELLARDARNALYARGPRWRMTAEMVRDGALRASGLLAGRVGGPSVKPYQPEGIWNSLNSFYQYPAPESVPQDDLHRRTLYTFVKRNALHPGLRIFDFTNRVESTARRRASNTPLQALELMNDPQYVEAYRSLATLALRFAADEDTQLARLYRLGTRATPTDEHLAVLRAYYRTQREEYAANEAKAASMLDVGVVAPDPTLDRATLAALTNVAAVVMNSPDAYTVR